MASLNIAIIFYTLRDLFRFLLVCLSTLLWKAYKFFHYAKASTYFSRQPFRHLFFHFSCHFSIHSGFSVWFSALCSQGKFCLASISISQGFQFALWLLPLGSCFWAAFPFCVALLGWCSFALVPSWPTSTITKGKWSINPSPSRPHPSQKTLNRLWPLLDQYIKAIWMHQLNKTEQSKVKHS